MNHKILVVMFSILGAASFAQYAGCKKGGPVIPYDIPWPTPTPVTGDITAGVIDNGSPVAGVTVFAVDPYGTTLTAVTDSFGLAAFNPAILSVGNWTMEVPTQGRYYFSSLPLVVSGGGSNSVTFQAGTQTIAVTPVSAETYGSSNTDVSYNITYNQPNNLNVPVVLSTAGLPAGWGKNFQPVTIGTSVGSSAATVTKNGCYLQNYPFSFDAKDLLGGMIDSKPATISRGYPVPVAINLTGTVSYYNPPGNTYQFDISFSSSNDCNYSYSLKTVVWATTTIPVTFYNNTRNFINGQSQYVSVVGGASNNRVNSTYIDCYLTTPTTVLSGSLTTSASFNTNVINTSY